MPAFAVPARCADDALPEAREALAYWEDRARRLPLHAVLRRREARAMRFRWAARVADAERERYGRGVVGALVLLACEGRMPQPARQAGRRLARRAGQATAVAGLVLVTLLVAAMAVVVELVSALV